MDSFTDMHKASPYTIIIFASICFDLLDFSSETTQYCTNILLTKRISRISFRTIRVSKN